ncbi:hypothetical protein NFI96_003503 [Prochilodus magdalenae]|nr:hypothetical protein NFI96_003503 [Prochilodus magdalenae]
MGESNGGVQWGSPMGESNGGVQWGSPTDGTPLSWWLDRGGERRTYWGGFLPGVQQCSCSLAENCIDMNYFCNCDADRNSWENDTGLLSYKDHLPITEIVVGDTNRTGSEAVYRVGSLQCYGDSKGSFIRSALFSWFGASLFHIGVEMVGNVNVGTAFEENNTLPEVPADGAVGVEVEGHQVFWTCDNKPSILVLTTVPPHTDSLGVSTKTKAGLVTEDDPLPF